MLRQFVKLKNRVDEQFSVIPILVLLGEPASTRHSLFQLGMIDYLTAPLLCEEASVRIHNTFDYNAQRKRLSLETTEPNLNRKYNMVKSTIAYLLDNIDKDVSLAQLSREHSTNRSSLSDAFKQYTGITIFTWLRDQRLQRAALMLETTALSVTRISEDVGYGNSNNFSAAFKKAFALSPLQYRKQKQQLKQL